MPVQHARRYASSLANARTPPKKQIYRVLARRIPNTSSPILKAPTVAAVTPRKAPKQKEPAVATTAAPVAEVAPVKRQISMGQFYLQCFKGVPDTFRNSYASSARGKELANLDQYPSWDDEKLGRSSWYDMKLTAFYLASPVALAWVGGLPFLGLLPAWPLLWITAQFSPSITPSYGMRKVPGEFPPFYALRNPPQSSATKLIKQASIAFQSAKDSEKLAPFVEKWNLFESSLPAVPKKSFFAREKFEPLSPKESKALLDDIRAIYRSVDSIAPLIDAKFATNNMSRTAMKASMRLNGLTPFLVGSNQFLPVRPFWQVNSYRLLKNVQRIFLDDSFLWDRNARIDMTDVREILNKRVGLPKNIVRTLSPDVAMAIANTYIQFSHGMCGIGPKAADFENLAANTSSYNLAKALVVRRSQK